MIFVITLFVLIFFLNISLSNASPTASIEVELSKNDNWDITHIEQMAHLTAMAYCSNLYLFHENQLFKRRGVLRMHSTESQNES
jgi:hypothetical protein